MYKIKTHLFKPFYRLNVFWLLSFPLFFLLLLRFSQYSALEPHGFYYFGLLSVVQAGFFSWLSAVCIPAIIHLLTGKKWASHYVAIPLVSCFLFFLFLDGFIYSAFHFHLNGSLVQMALSPARKQIFNLTTVEYACLFLAFLGANILSLLLWRLSRNWEKVLVYAYCSQIVLFISFLVTQGIYMWADAVYNPSLLMATELSPAFYGATAKRFLLSHHFIQNNPRPLNVSRIGGGVFSYPIHPLQIEKRLKKPNILLIAIDSWRADAFNQRVTPHLMNFASSASIYNNHFSGGNCTRAGIFSLFYSMSPNEFDTLYRQAKGPLLFDVLYQQGYNVAVYTSASAVSPPFHRTAFTNVKQFEPNLIDGSSIARDQEVTRRLEKFINQSASTGQPFFAFGFYDSAHAYEFPGTGPFQPSEQVSHLNLKDKNNQILIYNQYLNSLNFIDGLINDVVGALRKKNLLENTIVMITGDHGEEFNDNDSGLWGHNSNFTFAQTKVPLIIYWPKKRKQRVYHHVTSHYDIVPTLLHDILGVLNPLADYSLGTLLNDSRVKPVIMMGSYNNLAAYFPARKKMMVSNGLGYFQLRDLQDKPLHTGIDPDMFTLIYQQMRHFSLRYKL